MFDEYLSLALLLSSEMLKNGGETYRAEECAINILKAGGAEDVQILALPTGITVTAVYGGQTYTRVRSFKDRRNHLGNIDLVNTLSREIVLKKLTPAEATERLQQAKPQKNARLLTGLVACVSAGAFTVMLGGSVKEAAISLFVGLFAQGFMALLRKMGSISFFSSLGGSVLTALLAKLMLYVIPGLNIEVIIIGGIMPMLPGLAMINAIRDALYGDLVSGAARSIEAALSAIAIAAGAGIVLAL